MSGSHEVDIIMEILLFFFLLLFSVLSLEVDQTSSPLVDFNLSCFFHADPPKNTSILARPSPVVDAGRPLTLTCSSQAYPAVENFTWHRLTPDGGSAQC